MLIWKVISIQFPSFLLIIVGHVGDSSLLEYLQHRGHPVPVLAVIKLSLTIKITVNSYLDSYV